MTDMPDLPPEPWQAPLPWALPFEPERPHDYVRPPQFVRDWAAHVAAGRIGVRLPVDPAVAANRDATARLFARPKGRW